MPDVLLPGEDVRGLEVRDEAMSRLPIGVHNQVLHMVRYCGFGHGSRDEENALCSFRVFGSRKDFLRVRLSEVHTAGR